MKWAKPKPLRDLRTTEQREHDEQCFRFYGKDELKAEFGNKNIWKKHPFRFRFKSEEEYVSFQDRYETFVGGYLYFYDERNRSGVVDNVLYFKWSPYNKSGNEYSVTIYLSPAPLTKKFKGRIASLSSSNGNALKSTDAGTAKGGTQTVMLKKAVGNTVMALDGGDGETEGAIDPPPPPPPPPPRLHE
jgi:hypothetical protein